MANADLLSPDASPAEVSDKRIGVKRVNNVPVALILGVAVVFLLAVILVASNRTQQANNTTEAIDKAGDSSQAAKDIVGDRLDGQIAPKQVELPPPSVPALPAGAPAPELVVRDEFADRMRDRRLSEMEKATKAKTRLDTQGLGSTQLSGGAPRSREEAAARIAAANGDVSAQYRNRLNQLQTTGLLGVPGGAANLAGAAASGPTMGSASRRGDFAQFDGTEDRWKLSSTLQPPTTRFELRAGFVIPATLISGINSDLPGQIVAQVSQDVFDTATGRFKLIPQGARLVGSYGSEPAFGQSRVLVAWQRIVFPDGKALDIGSMPGADSAGYGGFADKVDNHYFRVFGSALLMSAVVAGVSYSQDANQSQQSLNGNRQTAGGALSEALGQQLGQVMAQMIAKNLNVSPTLEIRPGFRFNVIVTKDLAFEKPYGSFDY